MDTCPACGAALPGGAAWCGQCFAARPAAPVASTGLMAATPTGVPSRAFTPATPTPRPPMRRTRWAKTPTTFGPVGRVVATLLLLAPFAVMVVGGLADPFAWGGAGLYLVVVVPWGLRDIWKAGVLPLG